ncbi:amidase [Halomonas binhaiensis]|uniref:Amidase n=1 Tax=Halomonas binhaiensis TaxID=2562282 RepID=A0A5C1N9G1_9GAMM|nr:amidase [Halomonas binhaiensis]QEM80342.1 amidase [Halomonas binhaiensis]
MTSSPSAIEAAADWLARPPQQRPITSLIRAYQGEAFGPLDLVQALDQRHAQLGRAATTSISEFCPSRLLRDAEGETLLGMQRRHVPLFGVPVTIKDLFDERGKITRAGSTVLADAPVAKRNAVALDRLRGAGALHAGRTSMSEFAFSGLGLNPHMGTPPNPFNSDHITGGSTSGGAASVALGLAAATLGSDTGGSLRIPAAFCGLTGFKPSQDSVPLDGSFPLSPSLDCIGPIAPTVACCALMWQVLSGAITVEAPRRPLTLLVPAGELSEEVDSDVAQAFAAAVHKLEQLGCRIVRQSLSSIDEAYAINQRGGLVVPEAAAVHHHLLEQHAGLYDPMIAERLRGGRDITASEYLARLWPREGLQSRFAQQVRDVDAVLMPTVAMRSPRRDVVENDMQEFQRLNRRALRNTSVFNYLDACAISLPYFIADDEEPIGLMLARPQHQDAELLGVAEGVERLLAS